MKRLPFTPPMFEAWLDGRKDVTRRLINPQPNIVVPGEHEIIVYRENEQREPVEIKPHYRPGDIVSPVTRWAAPQEIDHLRPSQLPPCPIWVLEEYYSENTDYYGCRTRGKWRPGRFLPKHLERAFPKATIISARAERLHDITADDVIREGATEKANFVSSDYGWSMDWRDPNLSAVSTIHSFILYWGKIHGRKSWESDPWVWRVEISGPIWGES